MDLVIPAWVFLVSAPFIFPGIYFALMKYVLKTSWKTKLGKQLLIPFIGITIVLECAIVEMDVFKSLLIPALILYPLALSCLVLTFYYFVKSLKIYREMIEQTTTSLNASLQETTAASTQISSSAEGIVHKAFELGTILQSLQQASDTMKIITINANIEAGRLGDQGRGFTTVVNELQKLNEEMKQQAEKSKKELGNFLDHAEEISTATEEQTATMEEITSLMEHLVREVKG